MQSDQAVLDRALDRYVAEYGGQWPDAISVARRFRGLIRDWPACLDRGRMPGHLTASAWVCDPSGEAVLLTHHRKLDRWIQLGGHADGVGDLYRVACTEAEEEAGVTELRAEPTGAPTIFDLDIHPIPPYRSVPAHLHFDVRFAFSLPEKVVPRVSDESHDVQWVPISELATYTRERSIRRMAEKWYRLKHERRGRSRPV